MKIVIDDKIPFIKGQAERLGECIYLPSEAINAKSVEEADALIIRTRTKCDASLLAQSNVKFIATATIGYDHLSLKYLERHGIKWTNCPGCNASSVAQYVINSLLLLEKEKGIKLATELVGIIGVGYVGEAVRKALEKRNIRYLLCDPFRKERGEKGFVDLAQIYEQATIFTFHTPLTREGEHKTYHLFNESVLQKLSKGCILINSSRGEVVDTKAVLKGLESGVLQDVIIDTWENEPFISKELLEKAFIGTPHIAGYSADGKAKATQMALQAVADFFGIAENFQIAPPSITLKEPDINKELVLYNPAIDSEKLKKEPALFEYYRNHYPLRREKYD